MSRVDIKFNMPHKFPQVTVDPISLGFPTQLVYFLLLIKQEDRLVKLSEKKFILDQSPRPR
jgi:hypothetical protein